MKPCIREVHAKSILSKTGIPDIDYCINPYTGCSHACRYCYATFMKRFTGHAEPWGNFVDVKENALEILGKQLKRAKRGKIILSSVTDPYQPVEAKYEITRKCLEVLALYQLPVNILTKSPLVLRDLDIIRTMKEVSVGLTITTDNEKIRKIFEPKAPPIQARIDAIKKLHIAGIDTYVFIGPLLPMNPESLAGSIKPHVSRVLIDRMNYMGKTKWIYKKHRLDKWLESDFTEQIVSKLRAYFSGKEVDLC